MFIVIIGGSASGKSQFAEDLALSLTGSPRLYIATMQPFDAECWQKIARHRALRSAKQFSTVECYTGLSRVWVPQNSLVLLECMSNLLANTLYHPQSAGEEQALAEIRMGIHSLRKQCRHLLVVSNELHCAGLNYDVDTIRYMQLLARLNRDLVAAADCAVEVSAGLAIWHKGGERYQDS